MAISSNVSLLAQSRAQSQRLTSLRATMDNLQRQVSSQKKYENLTGFGVKSSELQRMRSQSPILETYISNIDKASSIMEQTSTIMSEISEIANNLTSAIRLREQDQAGTESVALFAQDSLDYIESLLNQRGTDGNYIFSGAEIATAPFQDRAIVESNTSTQVTQWLDGTITKDQMMTNVNAFDTTDLGLSNSLATAQDRNIRVSDTIDVNYGIKADIDGIKDVIRALSLVANLQHPGGADVGTEAELESIFNEASDIAIAGGEHIKSENEKLASKFSLVKSIKENHQVDFDLYQKEIDSLENVDTAEVLIKMQILQTQLTASYQVTNMVGSLSLTNYI